MMDVKQNGIVFSDLVSIPEIQEMMNTFHRMNRLPMALLDNSSKVLAHVGWQRICTHFHRVHPKTLQRCHQSDSFILKHIDQKRAIEYTCKNGLVDLAYPIFVNNCHVATIFLGQFFIEGEKPEVDFFEKQALENGFNPTDYISAYNEVPVYSRQHISTVMEWYITFAQLLSQQAETNLRLSGEIEERKAYEERLRESESNFRHLAEKSPTGILIYQNNKWIFTNKAGSDITKYSPEELYAMDFWEIVHPDYVEWIKELGIRRQKGDNTLPSRFEFAIVTKYNEVRWVDLSGSLTEYGGRPAGIISVIDITERRKAEELLMKSESKFRSIFELSMDIICVADMETVSFIEVNPSISRILGYPLNEVIGRNFFDFIHPDDIESTQKIISDQLRKGDDIFRFVNRYRCKSGEYKWLSWNSHPVPEKNLIYGVAHDITETIKAQDELLFSKQMLENVLNNIPGRVFWKDIDSRYLGCNNNFALDTKVSSAQEVIGKTDYDLFENKTEAEAYRADDKYVLQKKSCKLNIEEPQTRNGEENWLLTNKVPLFDSNQQVIGVLGTYDDITQRIKTQESLRNLSNKLILQNRIAKAIITKNNKDFYLTVLKLILKKYHCNRGSFNRFDNYGRLVKTILNEKTHKTVITDDSTTLQDTCEECIKTQKPILKNNDYNCNQFSEKMSGMAAPVIFDKKLVGQVVIVSQTRTFSFDELNELIDICDYLGPLIYAAQKEELYEKQLVAEKERAEQNDKLKSAFLMNLSHELRTPLNGIMGFAKLLTEESTTTESEGSYAKIIIDNSLRLLDTVNDIIDISFIQTGQYKIKLSEFDLIKLLHEIFDINAQKFAQSLSKISFNISIDPIFGSTCTVKSDINALKIVLNKLLDNAFKYSQSGDIVLSLTLNSNLQPSVSVTDSGCGVNEKEVSDLFKEFCKGLNNSCSDTEGLGLGLPIAKGLLNKLHSELHYKPNPKGGSVFYFEIVQ
jgi:PAS domain S-box-containing protein